MTAHVCLSVACLIVCSQASYSSSYASGGGSGLVCTRFCGAVRIPAYFSVLQPTDTNAVHAPSLTIAVAGVGKQAVSGGGTNAVSAGITAAGRDVSILATGDADDTLYSGNANFKPNTSGSGGGVLMMGSFFRFDTLPTMNGAPLNGALFDARRGEIIKPVGS